ncbi:MAG: hypothetical protein CVU39_22420 [Chloroflexi bacterium HGW-Chloroflexi-10]|nr:MAG: hypothetical protein CVU39_22420 [Chloroflexi bacterium HGW-Chloroflexi-10]
MEHQTVTRGIRRPNISFISRLFLILLVVSSGLAFTPARSIYAAGTYTVNRTDDIAPRSTATTCITAASSDCSLREAVIKANANPGSTIQFAVGLNGTPIVLTRTGNDATASAGDLDINASTNIVGNGAFNTIIQGAADAGYTNSIGDKIFGVNQDGFFNNLTVNFSGLTIRYGDNNVPNFDPSFAYTGGGVDVYQTGTSNAVSFTDCVISYNRARNSDGGGLNYIVLASDTGSLNLTNVTFDHNQALGASGTGGALKIAGGNSTVVTISHSSFTNNTAFSSGGAIRVVNGTLHISHSIIDSNATGNGTYDYGGGIYLTSGVSSALITDSQITNNFAGGGGGAMGIESDATIINSRIAGNTSTNGGRGLDIYGPKTVTATNNWWGCSAGPSDAACDNAVTGNGAVINYTPWFQDRLTAAASPLAVNQSTTLTASFLNNSAGTSVPASSLSSLINQPVTWNATGGNLTDAQVVIQSSGTATSTFHAASVGAASIYARVDNDKTTAPSSNVISLTINKANTTAAINSTTPNPSVPGEAVTVNYSVTGAYGNSPTMPTGNVTISDGAGNSCSASVAAGSCPITFASVGMKTLTATYAGDLNFNASPASAGFSHNVSNPVSITSFTLQSPASSPTNADVLVFRATFSKAVQNVDVADFSVNGTTTATVTGVAMVSDSLYDVTISGGNLASFEGIVGLNLAGSPSISDADGNALPAGEPAIDQTYLLDNTAPILTSITRQTPASSPTNADVLVFRVTFNGAVLNVDVTDFDVDGSSSADVTSVALVSDGIYDVTVSGGDLASFNGTAGVNLNNGQNITDAAGNPLADGEPATDELYTLDNSIPSVTMSSTSSNPTKTSPIAVAVTFSESVTGFTSGEITPNNALVSNFSGSGASYTFDLTPSGQGIVTANIAANAAVDPAGNTNTAATQFSRTYDSVRPTVTIEKAAGQPDPAGSSPINFTVVFNETVTGFTAEDVSLSGTAGAATAVVTGGPTTYNVAVSGMTADGTVIASVPAGGAEDAAGNTNVVSTSSDNSVLYDMTSPSVTINQAVGQPDPTNASPINFTVEFSETVTGFLTGDVDLSGSTAPGTLIGTITGGPATYNVAVSGMTGDGTVIASIPFNAAIDQASRPNEISTSDDNSVAYDNTNPAAPLVVTPADGSSIKDITPDISGTAEANSTITIRIDGSVAGTVNADSSGNWTFTLSSALSAGPHTVYAVAADSAGNVSVNSNTNTFTVDVTRPTVMIEKAAGQSDPAGSSPINFTVIFNETVTGFTAEDVSLSGTAGAATAVVTGSGTTYNVAVSGMTADGTVIASVPSGGAQDAAGNTNVVSTSSDNSVLYDIAAPSVSINQAVGQPDPTNASPINFTVIFSEAVTGFLSGDVDLSGSTAPGTLIGTITGGPATYNVAVSGMTGDGTVIASIPFGAAADQASRPNEISTSDDNSVAYDNTNPAAPVVVTPADGSSIKDITPTISGTAEANSTVTVWLDGSAVGTANTDGSGNWTFTLSSPLTVGSHTVYAVAADSVGNVSVDSNTNTFTVDVFYMIFPLVYFMADN